MGSLFFRGDIEVRPQERRVLIHGAPAPLGGRAFDVLAALMDRRDQLVPKEELMSAVWPGVAVEENNLTVQVSALRKVLGADAIATVAGRGYQFTLAPGAAARPTRRAATAALVAVLAFDNLSSDADLTFFSDGVSDEIIQRLSRAHDLRIISRTSSFQFRGAAKSNAADQLGCDYVLDGSIQRGGGRMRVNAQLTEVGSKTTIWSERFDREVDDILAVQDDIAQSIAASLRHAISGANRQKIAPADYDLYLRSNPSSYSPDDLRKSVNLLEVVTERSPDFAEAWGRAAYLRGFLHVYLPYTERKANAARVKHEAATALALDPGNIDALAGRCFVAPTFGEFSEGDKALEDLQRARGGGDGRRYIGWFLRHTGRVREALEETEIAYRLDPLDPMSINLLALARMAAGRVSDAIPLFSDLVERIPKMSFPISSLLRAHALQGDWDAVDRYLAIAETRPLPEFQDTIPFVRAKRDRQHVDAWRGAFEAHIAKTGWVDVARLVFAAHLGLADDAYRALDVARLGPTGGVDDLIGPDAYRTALLFQANLPELRNDARFPRLCARLGLVDFWIGSGKWPDCVSETPYDFKRGCDQARDTPREAFAFD
ncbi:MAG: winged helix-turn-helix domain-containing tetratricopeptide repeat protein [Caulobacterales bacterium]